MTRYRGRLYRLALGISPEETTFARRQFRGGDAGVRRRLEAAGQTFLEGYHAALRDEGPECLAAGLRSIDAEIQGFGFEGAAMGLSLLDLLLPWGGGRLDAFLSGPAAPHAYMVHVGVGWALARLRRPVERPLGRFDPVLRWLVTDGYGFHEGYFRWRRYVERRATPEGLSGYALRGFDQGLGRSLWFVEGADVARIATAIAAFLPSRRSDLWSGIGLACAYAGGVDEAAVGALRAAAGPYRPQLAQGAAFAAKARQRAGNPAPHTDLACRVLCGLSADEAAGVTDTTLEGLPGDGPEPAFEVWRRRIRAQLTGLQEVTP